MLKWMSSEILSKLIGVVEKTLGIVKNKYSWDGMFLKAGDTVIAFEAEKYVSDSLKAIFSEENMKELAEELTDTSDYQLLNNLRLKIAERLREYELPEELVERYTDYFIHVFSSELEIEFPEIYSHCYMNEMIGKCEDSINVLHNSLNALIEVRNTYSNYFTVQHMNEYLQMITNNSNFDLSFFEIDDYVFQEKFADMITLPKVCVVGNNLEETRYSVIHELMRLGYSDRLVIVKDSCSWKQIMDYGIYDKIVIPLFVDDEIPVIKNNTNIFVFSKDYLNQDNQSLELRRRTKSKIYNCLTKAGYGFEKVNQLMNQTNGLFSLLKGKLFVNLCLYQKGIWGDSSVSKAVLTALLCGKWTESEGDIEIIQRISGMSYEDFINEISPYMEIELPLVIKNSSESVVSYQLVGCEDAWGVLEGRVSSNTEIWNRFVACFKTVVREIDLKFDLPLEQHSFASILGKKSIWSNSLKEGMTRTLVMKAIHGYGNSSQYEIDAIVRDLLQEIHSEKQWFSFSGLINLLCEASPCAVMEKLEQSINEEVFISVFRRQSSDLFAPAYYVHYLMVIERLSSLKIYCSRAILLLVKLAGYKIKYLSNNPVGVLKDIFCVWMNIVPLTSAEKLQLADQLFSEYDLLWEVFSGELPDRHKSMVSSVSSFHYRTSDKIEKYYMSDVFTLSIGYLKLCLKHINSDSSRWINILSVLYHYDISIVKEAFVKLSGFCAICSDDDRIKIKNHLRDTIHRHQYCSGNDWTMDKEYLDLYLDMMESIHTENQFYEYLYFFYPDYHFPLINPEHIDSESSHQKNQQKRNNEIKNGFAKLAAEDIDMLDFVRFVEEKKFLLGEQFVQVGGIFAEFYSDDIFDLNFALKLFEVSHKVFVDYCLRMLWKETVQADEILSAVGNVLSDEEKASILSVNLIQNKLTIDTQSDEVKKHCWGNYSLRIRDDISLDDRLWAIEQCCEYGTIDSLLIMLYDFRSYLTNEQLYDAVIKLKGMRYDHFNHDFMLKELLEQLYDAYGEDEERSLALVHVELFFRTVLDWRELKFLKRMMEKNPEAYASVLSMIFKKDNEAENKQDNEEKRKIATSVYDLYHKAQFCPAEKRGKVDEDELTTWVNGFISAMVNFDLKSQISSALGRLFAFAPVGEDGIYPCEPVRKVMEKMYDERLHSSFSVTERNKRGVYNETAGFEELRLSKKYEENAKGLAVLYPKTASIYYSISENYRYQSIRERERAENE